MKYYNMIKEARTRYNLSEEEMWKSVKILDDVMEYVKTADPRLAMLTEVKFLDITNKGHFPLDYAEEIVGTLHSSGAKGKHWTIEQIDTTANKLGLSFPTSATSGDKLFAFNSFWHDMHNNGDTEEKIFTDAYLFYFDDADFEGNSKPWKYYKGMIW